MLLTSFAGPAANPQDILRVCEQAGATSIGLHAGLTRDQVDTLTTLLAGSSLKVRLVESPLGAGREGTARLSAIDRDEAQTALSAARVTLRRASELGAHDVAVNLGEVVGLDRDWDYARGRFLRGTLDSAIALKLKRARDSAKDRSFDAARRSLEILASEASDVRLLVRCPRRYVDFPSPIEWAQLVAELSGAPMAPLFDLPSAHLLDQMGFQPLDLTRETFAGPVVYVGDACGPVGALGPGRGIVDVAEVVKQLGNKVERWAFRPWPGLSPAEVAEAFSGLSKIVPGLTE